jgi:hypothetical protein
LNLFKIKIFKYIRVIPCNFLKNCAFAVVLIFSILYSSFAQKRPAREQEIKAAFIYNFTRFIDWPPQAYSAVNAPFIIGVVGNDPVSASLADLVKDEKLGNHIITVQRFSDLKQISQCNILFISAEEASRNNKLILSINRRGILTVSDVPDFSKWGGIVRFFKAENRLRLEINPIEAKAAELTISSKLLNISSIYKAH